MGSRKAKPSALREAQVDRHAAKGKSPAIPLEEENVRQAAIAGLLAAANVPGREQVGLGGNPVPKHMCDARVI
jgi:hypothetical protein